MHPHLSRDVCQNFHPILQFHPEHAVRKRLKNCTFQFNAFFLILGRRPVGPSTGELPFHLCTFSWQSTIYPAFLTDPVLISFIFASRQFHSRTLGLPRPKLTQPLSRLSLQTKLVNHNRMRQFGLGQKIHNRNVLRLKNSIPHFILAKSGHKSFLA